MNSIKSLEKIRYIYDEDMWFFPQKEQFNIMCYWVRKINPHSKKLYYINPNISIYQTTSKTKKYVRE